MILGIMVVILSRRHPPTPPIEFPPPSSPFEHSIAGVGLIEPASENVFIGSPFSEIVREIYVVAGDYKQKGDPLFQLDTSSIEKELAARQKAVEVAFANYQKQLDLPRREDVPPQIARLKRSEAALGEELTRLSLFESVENPKAISVDELTIRQYAAQIAQYEMEEVKAELDLILAGAWIRDLEIVREELKQQEAERDIIAKNLERYTVRAPFDGQVLKVNVHPGEFVASVRTNIIDDPLVLYGSTAPFFHLRVDVDEDDAWRVIRGAKGRAFVRGNSALQFPIDFVRIEPYMIPKRQLTDEDTEQVDIRVLQLIYRFEPREFRLFAGQLVDVYIEGRPNRWGKKDS